MTFVYCDVSDFDLTVKAFKHAYEWSPKKRIDFFAANAGTTTSVAANRGLWGFDMDREMEKPDLHTIEVNLFSCFYGLKCFLYYVRKTRGELQRAGPEDSTGKQETRREQHDDGDDGYHPKMVCMSSSAGLYKFPYDPMYSSSKAAIANFVRSMSDRLYQKDRVCLNAIAPGYVDTPIFPEQVRNRVPEEAKTPMSVMMKIFEELIQESSDDDVHAKADSETTVIPKFGKIVESSATNFYYREMLEYPDENMRFLIDPPKRSNR